MAGWLSARRSIRPTLHTLRHITIARATRMRFNPCMLPLNRRRFLAESLATVATVATVGFSARGFAQTYPSPASPTPPTPIQERKRPPALDPNLVREFVSAGHSDLPKVQQLVREHPTIVNASWDLGGGDWETSLGAASHTGQREIALFLLGSGARIDAFCIAMLGETDVLVPLVRVSPDIANTRGPHGISLLYHVGYSGSIRMAEALEPYLTTRARDCNAALLSATPRGHTEFVAWLLKHGADNPNLKAFDKKTPLDLALEQNHREIATLLRAAGGMSTR